MLTAEGENIYLKNLSRNLLVRSITGKDVAIDTKGSINTTPDGMITANNLKIHASGNIGSATEPLRINVSGKTDFSTEMGLVWFRNFFSAWRWLIDEETQIGILGIFARDAQISVITTAELQKMTDVADAITALLWKLIANGDTLYDFVIGLLSDAETVCYSMMYVRIDLHELDENYDDSLEGQTVYVLAGVAGKLICVKTVVKDGVICLSLNALGMNEADFGYTQFAVVDEETFERLQSEGLLENAEIFEFEGIPAYLPPFPKKK